MNNPDHIFESLKTIFGVKILKFFDADPGPGMEKILIRDKHHVSGIRSTLGFNADSYPAFIPMRIRIWIQGDKTMRVHADPDPDQTL
jgi:hypothetical protein